MNNASIIDILNGLFWIAMGVFSLYMYYSCFLINMQNTIYKYFRLPKQFWIIAAVSLSLNGIFIVVKALRDVF